jgi:antitoxin ParD1/3/4
LRAPKKRLIDNEDAAEHHPFMDTIDLQQALPEPLRDYVTRRVREGAYADTGEYLRDLVRRDREDQAAKRLRELIEEGLNSGAPREMSAEDWAELRRVALRQPA